MKQRAGTRRLAPPMCEGTPKSVRVDIGNLVMDRSGRAAAAVAGPTEAAPAAPRRRPLGGSLASRRSTDAPVIPFRCRRNIVEPDLVGGAACRVPPGHEQHELELFEIPGRSAVVRMATGDAAVQPPAHRRDMPEVPAGARPAGPGGAWL